MTAEFRMPSLGADMEAGRVVEWRVKPGDRIARGEVIVEIETDKGTFEVESPHTGLVTDIAVGAGAKVAVGTVLASVAGDDVRPGVVAPTAPAAPPTPGGPAPAARIVEAPPRMAPPPRPGRELAAPPATLAIRASPAARRLAADRGVDLATVAGTGPGGAVVIADVERVVHAPREEPAAALGARASPVARRVAQALGVDLARVAGTGAGGTITKADVERAASLAREAPPPVVAAAPPAPVPEAADAHAAMRRAIAAAVSRSKREIPHYYLGTDIDLSLALDWMERTNLQRPVAQRLLPAALLIKAVAVALGKFPELNGYWIDGAFHPGGAVNIGVAISVRGGGLVVPAILGTDRKSLDEVMAALRDLVRRARAGGLRGSEITSATVTVTSLGDEGASTVFGVIYPPQVAVVGLGRIVERPWAEHGMLGVRRVVTATLAADHRATDGHYGGLFLAEVGRLLHTPESL